MAAYSDLEKSILKSLIHFDLLDYPLTLVEIFKFLYQPNNCHLLSEVKQALDSPELKVVIEEKNGFYFLAGRQGIVRMRLDRYQLAEEKYKIALRAARWLRWLGGLEFIAVCNKAGYNNAARESDIDFFIIVRSGRLWWTRMLVTALVTLLGIRRHDLKYINRICLSFYITDSHLDLADITLKPEDPHLAFWLATFVPIYDLGIGKNFFAANTWFAQRLPNFYRPLMTDRRLVKDNIFVRFSKAIDETIIGSKVGAWLEEMAKNLQAKKIKKYFGSLIEESNTNVVITPTILKFHKNDRRREYLNLWQKKWKNLQAR